MDEPPNKLGTALAWIGLVTMIVLVLIRAMVEHDPFPWWEADPFVFSPPVIGLTPTKALVLDLAIVVSASLALFGFFLRRERLSRISIILMTIGVALIGFHGVARFESVLDGSNLLAVVSVLFVASCAHTLRDAQRLIGAITLGFALLLVVMGSYEVFVVHPQTIANYQQTRDSFLAARGWTPGSFEALAYERRLNQPEPIAWFGLTNVFASFTGAGAAGLLMLGWGARSHPKNSRVSLIFLLGGLLAFLGLILSGAKGGFGAFGLGLGLAIMGITGRGRLGNGRAIVAACGLVMLGVLGRGLIGEKIGELSLLFRFQYIVGSIRMWFHHLLVGVGPGAFQENYAFYKPALSPEDVASAHNVLFDLVATLGVGGLALGLMLILVIWRIRPQTQPKPVEPRMEQRRLVQIAMLAIGAGTVVSIRFGSPAMDLNLLVVQVLGSLVWGAMTLLIVTRADLDRSLRWAMFASAGVLAIHAMIEVSATWAVSGMLWALMVGGACTTSTSAHPSPPESRPSRFWTLLAIIAMLGAGSIFGARLTTIARWEHALEDAGEPAMELSKVRAQMDELEQTSTPNQLGEQISAELSELRGHPVGRSIDELLDGLDQAEIEGHQTASQYLLEAVKIRPTHMPTHIACSQQLLWLASLDSANGRQAESDRLWNQALDLLQAGVSRSRGASGYQWLGSVWYGRAMQFPDASDRGAWLERANDNWERAFERTPHNPHLALKLMDTALARGLDADAGKWANTALTLHEQSRLDPVRGLGESDLMRSRAIARSFARVSP